MITLQNLSYKVFDNKEEKYILKNLNISFPKGKLTVITGQNGSGKSTLMKIIAGISKQSEGNVFFGEKNIDECSISQRANLGITTAFQQPVRFKGITVRDLINLASKKQNTVAQACEFLAKVGLCAKDYIDRPLDGTLSGGEMKRIELAMALAKGGEVFLFDEPEAGIDLWSFEELVGLFKELKGKTVIIVSHQKKILQSADFVMLLNRDGQAVFGEKIEVLDMIEQPQCRKMGGAK
ncbi:MAG: ABC transporter ATP-binding protein [Clostridia bacterium]|nr:ABC transporter ATP-binding protein [Clostridia bacterium]